MFDVIPINDQTWLICGGRNFDDQEMFGHAMGDLVRLKGVPKKIIHGACSGADKMGDSFAEKFALEMQRFPVRKADWKARGLAAGPIRNQQMIDEGKPDLVVAFPGGSGTADVVTRARQAGIDVAEIKVKE